MNEHAMLAVLAHHVPREVQPVGSMGDESAMRDAVVRFYEAVAHLQAGDPGPMRALWVQEPGVTLLPPRGDLLEGWPRIGAYWDAAALRTNDHIAQGLEASSLPLRRLP